MKLVILGAGASFDNINYYYDDVPDLSWRPPLANEIFDSRLNFRNLVHTYPGAAAMMSELNNVSDIEEFFQAKWNFVQNHKADELLANLINIQYYLSHLFQSISLNNLYLGNNNLDVLVQHAYEYATAKNEEVAFVTFNYDLFMERSLRKVYTSKGNLFFTHMDEYIKYPMKLFKLHGSCNWASELHLQIPAKDDIDIANHLYNERISYDDIKKVKEDGIGVQIDPQVRFNWEKKSFYFPELLIPFKDKDEFILPSMHLSMLKDMLAKVTDVLIIGWKGSEETFKKLLHQYTAEKEVIVTCVCCKISDEAKNIIKGLFPKGTFNFYEEASFVEKTDNTRVNFKNGQSESSFVYHSEGTFSSYILKVMRKEYKDFFEVQ